MVEKPIMNNREQRTREILEESSAFLKGHFEYTSGKHGDAYINKDAIYPNTTNISELCLYMAEPYRGKGIDTVLGPAMGGVILAQRVAEHLTEMEEHAVHAVYADKTGDGLEIKRGYDAFVEGRNVLVVEDILNTGGSARKAIEVTKNAGGNVIGLSALVNRGKVTSEDVVNTPIHSLLEINMDSWEPDNCPFCKSGVPLNTNVGHAKK